MEFKKMDEAEIQRLQKALRDNVENGTPLRMDPLTTGWQPGADEIDDDEVISAIKSVPCHYALRFYHYALRFYKMNADGSTEPLDGVLDWAHWIEIQGAEIRQIRYDEIDEIEVSTVFLGLDHSHSMDPMRSLLFETMVFGGPDDGSQERYSTYEEAIQGHDRHLNHQKLRHSEAK